MTHRRVVTDPLTALLLLLVHIFVYLLPIMYIPISNDNKADVEVVESEYVSQPTAVLARVRPGVTS